MNRLVGGLIVSTALMVAACDQSTSVSQASPSASPTRLSAGALIEEFKSRGLPISTVVVFTAATDQNSLLGRPHQYTGKASWLDSRLKTADSIPLPEGTPIPLPAQQIDISSGGSIETFASHDDLQARVNYMAGITKVPLFAEYDYYSVRGLSLIRLSGTLTPDQANEYLMASKQVYADLMMTK